MVHQSAGESANPGAAIASHASSAVEQAAAIEAVATRLDEGLESDVRLWKRGGWDLKTPEIVSDDTAKRQGEIAALRSAAGRLRDQAKTMAELEKIAADNGSTYDPDLVLFCRAVLPGRLSANRP